MWFLSAQLFGEGKQIFREQQAVFAERHHIGVVHGELDEEEAQYETEGQTARVAHENLLFFLHAAQHVEVEVGHEHAHQSGYQDGVGEEALAHEAEQKSAQR